MGNIHFNPLDRLRGLLMISGIEFTNNGSSDGILGYLDRVYYRNKKGELVCSAIWGKGSYGYEDDLIEIRGLLSDKEKEYDDVLGWLTPEEVFFRIWEYDRYFNKS